MLLMTGVYPSYHDWISKEIVACKNDWKLPIIAISRDPQLVVSPIVKQAADVILQWNSEEIVTAIRKLTKERTRRLDWHE